MVVIVESYLPFEDHYFKMIKASGSDSDSSQPDFQVDIPK